MAKRRMFSLDIVDTDIFLEMPASTQALYFHLGMRADDDGFVSSPRKITMMANCAMDDLKLLITKQFILPIGEGVVVIKDWKINNYIQKDRYTETRYTAEKLQLSVEDNGSYILMAPHGISQNEGCILPVYKTDTQVRLGKSKDSTVEDRERKEKGSKGEGRGSEGTIKGSSTRNQSNENNLSSPFFENLTLEFSFMENQIKNAYDKILQEDDRYPYVIDDVIRIFKIYFDTYQKNFGKRHPSFKFNAIQSIICDLPSCFNGYGEPINLSVELYELIIEKHFRTDYYGECDYNMLHFMSGQIRVLRYYEVC